ncbi:MAG TPA: helix-turn-helix domain-containing protein [Xanthobacteraceae bacterium]
MTTNSHSQSSFGSTIPGEEACTPAMRCIVGTQVTGPMGLLGRAEPLARLERPTVLIGEVGRLDMMGTLVSFQRGAHFYGESDPAEYLYRLASGMARGYRMTSEGRRQVVAFYMPGDLFGFELGCDHSFSVEAVCNAKARMIRLSAITATEAWDQDLAEKLRISLARELRRNQDHIRRLGQSAQERVASFLLEIAQRIPNNGTIELAMSRQDIADYLGLTIETVSRTLTHITRVGAISISRARKVTIRDPDLLSRLSAGCPDLPKPALHPLRKLRSGASRGYRVAPKYLLDGRSPS